MKGLSPTQEALNRALEVLKNGGILLTPTDTVWGLSCDATNEEAVEKLIQLKQRPAGKSFIVLLDADYKLEQYVRDVPGVAYDLIEYAEKPLTIIFPGARRLASSVINEDGSVGIRIVRQPSFCRKLLEKFRHPIVSTSANLSGQPAPAIFEEVDEILIKGVDYVVPAKEATPGTPRPSTIIRLGPGGEYSLIRK
ncbi:L-threonylcarbamoyladenylate synthase [Anseongella ginsenosidimutans]|uniref:L-threonylcarbamoyladenylate synthase n=1 Tax=Anseongella ginsenosidimutans TaxID=496056 RepID=A0A4R3KRI9_9SPHI|nr:L-threonylcarbamoyladenylate synthase [Anseongella ginsenosidimutans]QEC52339.1 threonylcarbamoyl-AMP synthase [Anseongella ginsenosidimutans]TCS86905.1 L-threonylcarbamoyladenylate synthase [Anseongella ginsenosidimutans]